MPSLLVSLASTALAAPLALDVPVGQIKADHFIIELRQQGPWSWLEVRRDGVVRWSTPPGEAFLVAAEDDTSLVESRGMVTVDEAARGWCGRQRVQRFEAVGPGVVLGGVLECPGRDVAWTARLDPIRHDTMRMKVTTADPNLDRVGLVTATENHSAVYGFGEQFDRIDLRGKRWPLVVSEQGIGRGKQPVTMGANMAAGAGGDWWTTYAGVPHFLTSDLVSVAFEGTAPVIADTRRGDVVALEALAPGFTARIYAGDTALDQISAHSLYAGRMQPLPDWVHSGAILGIQGGTERVNAVSEVVASREMPVAGLWLQDWVGRRTTSFGEQLWWSWTLDEERYPDWDPMVASLEAQGIKVLTYVNPFLVELPADAGRRDLYGVAAKSGLFVDKDGKPYPITNTDFDAGLLDLTDPTARAWAVSVVRNQVAGSGAMGWMADFGEALPFDAELHDGDAHAEHNAYPVRWAAVNRAAVEELEDSDQYVFFMRSAHTRSPGVAPLFWLGDQMVSWDRQDGLQSVVPGLVSSGISGFALNHSDIGGYTTITHPIADVHRSGELFQRWAELAAFTPVFRTHEGSRPAENHQWDSDPATLAHFDRMATVFACLQPYRKRLMAEAAAEGWPLVRHPWLHDPEQAAYQERRLDVFMLGADVFVAPVMKKGRKRVAATLPDGLWTHAWTGAVHTGGDRVRVKAPMGEPAVWVRSGSDVAAELRACVVELPPLP